MGKLITLLAVLGIGYGVYWKMTHKSPAYIAYLQWEDATRRGDCKTLYSLAEGSAKAWVDNYCTPAGGMSIMGRTVSGRSAADLVAELNNTPQGAMSTWRHHMENEDTTADGTVSMVITASVAGRGIQAAPPRRHEVLAKEIGGVWKLIEFKEPELAKP